MQLNKLFFIFLFFKIFICFSQAQLVTTVNNINTPYYFHPIQGKGVIADGIYLTLIDLVTGNKITVDSNLYTSYAFNGTPSIIVYNNFGLFYTTDSVSNQCNGCINHYVNFYSYGGNRYKTGVINNYLDTASYNNHDIRNYISPYLLVTTNKCYFTGLTNNQFNLWESDGTPSGTKIIHSSNVKIQNLTSINNKLFFTEQDSIGSYNLFSFQVGDTAAIQFTTLNPSNSNFQNIGNDGTSFYFINNYSIWKTDLTSLGTKIFCTSPVAQYASNISFKSDTFYIISSGASAYIFRGFNSQPDSLKQLVFSKKDYSISQHINNYYSDSFFVALSAEKGFELGKRNQYDSLQLITDLAKGTKSSQILPSYASYYNGNLYTIATNTNDNYHYLYKTDGNTMTSIFKINPTGLTNMFIDNGTLYWFVVGVGKLSLYKRYLTNTDPPQTTSLPPKSEEWYRQLGFIDKSYYYSAYNNQDATYPQKVFIDKNENVIVGTWFNWSHVIGFIYSSSDSNAIFPLKGCNVYCKYDKYGELQWTNSIGAIISDAGANNTFCLDTAGNVIVFGQYYQKGYFDTDSLVNPQEAMFVAKLDKKTGKVMWKKSLGQAQYVENFSTDGVVCDKDNNIYLTFLYSNFSFTVDGISITTNVSPANAILKLDSNGNSIWLKNITTPWTNEYGRTTGFTYDATNNNITAIQSQGNYNTGSSCKYMSWGNYVQTINTDGTILNAVQYISDDLGGVTTSTSFNGKLYATGYYRGNLSVGNFKFDTPTNSNGCNDNANFSFLTENSKLLHAFATSTELFYPFEAKAYQDTIYVVGASVNGNKQNLSIKKYNSNGVLVAKKDFENVIPNVFNFINNYNIEITNSHIVIIAPSVQGFDTCVNSISFVPSLSILKFKKGEGWVSDSEPDINLNSVSHDMLIYPNPTSNTINLLSLKLAEYDRAELYDILGQKVLLQPLTDEWSQSIDVSTLASGTYILKIMGSTNYSTKIIKR